MLSHSILPFFLMITTVMAAERPVIHVEPITPPGDWPKGVNFDNFGIGLTDMSIVNIDHPTVGNEPIERYAFDEIRELRWRNVKHLDHVIPLSSYVTRLTKFGEELHAMRFGGYRNRNGAVGWNVRGKEGFYLPARDDIVMTLWIKDAQGNILPVIEDDVHLFACAAQNDWYLRNETQLFFVPGQDCAGPLFPNAVRVNVVYIAAEYDTGAN